MKNILLAFSLFGLVSCGGPAAIYTHDSLFEWNKNDKINSMYIIVDAGIESKDLGVMMKNFSTEFQQRGMVGAATYVNERELNAVDKAAERMEQSQNDYLLYLDMYSANTSPVYFYYYKLVNRNTNTAVWEGKLSTSKNITIPKKLFQKMEKQGFLAPKLKKKS
ncbi:MAG: hypothetical protein Q4C75_00330 [Bergeyella zoohelcum]|nr:hypothetical protein [Bergeyella zoohelcum]